MAFKSPSPPLLYGRARSNCKFSLHYLLFLVSREVSLFPDQLRYVRIRTSEVSVVPC